MDLRRWYSVPLRPWAASRPRPRRCGHTAERVKISVCTRAEGPHRASRTAPSPSGKAEVCKTSIPGSNPGGASKMPVQIRSSVLAGRPLLRRHQQRVDPMADFLPHRARPRRRLPPHRRRAVDVLADRDPRDAEFLGDLPLRLAVDQHLMSNDMYLVHPEHPLQRTPELNSSASPPIRPSGGSLSERRAHSSDSEGCRASRRESCS